MNKEMALAILLIKLLMEELKAQEQKEMSTTIIKAPMGPV